VGELRNEIGSTSHGKSLEEIKQRNNNVDLLTREFLIDSVELVSVYMSYITFRKRFVFIDIGLFIHIKQYFTVSLRINALQKHIISLIPSNRSAVKQGVAMVKFATNCHFV
jgi:hypothetical protein